MASVMWKICVAILASALILSVTVEGNTQTGDDFVEGIWTGCGGEDCPESEVSYNTADEVCCGGIVYRKDFGPNREQLSKCCPLVTENGVNGVMYSTETQDCCNLRTIIDKSTHACCGNSGSYELATKGCCNGEIYDKEEKICCNGADLHRKSEGDSCCGNIPYHSKMSTCCAGEVKEGIGECCGNNVYVPNKDLCCQTIEGSVVYTPDSHDFSSKAVQCCGTDTYRPADQLCCNMVVHTKDSHSSECCGRSTYDENTEICCQGLVSSRDTETACCGSVPFNEDNDACCNGEVMSLKGHASCCNGEPYNKESSTCMDQYGIGGFIEMVSDIPEITLKFFGDNSTAYLRTEQFECGGQLYKYKEGSTSCCARSMVYDSSRYLCCSSNTDSFLVPKTSSNAMCCGEGSFIPDTEGCCNGNQTFVMATQQCCPDGVVRGKDENCDDLPECSVQRGNDKKCIVYNPDDYPEERVIPYNSDTAVCTPSGVRALPPGLASCGDQVYRTSEEICCQDKIVRRFQNNMERECCHTYYGSKQYYTPKTETCYNWMIHPIPKNVSEICMGHVYDSRYDGCDVVGRIRRKEEILEKPDACYNEQTGLFYFNKLHHSCCAGHLIAPGHTCCDVSNECCQPNERQGYNTETHICCDGHLVEKQEGHVCCGTQTYDPRDSTQLCCLNKLNDGHNGNVRCEGETITGRIAENEIICRDKIYNGDNIECCGAEKYDLEEEICCRDFKYTKTSDTQDCCGAVPYDTSDDTLCCGDSLYEDVDRNDKCCGNVTFDTTSSTCCTTGGSEYVMSPGQCCSNGEEFDSSTHTCCDGLIHNYIANGECCGNHVIREPTREFCCAGRLVHHYGDKKCCDGRVISSYQECSDEN